MKCHVLKEPVSYSDVEGTKQRVLSCPHGLSQLLIQVSTDLLRQVYRGPLTPKPADPPCPEQGAWHGGAGSETAPGNPQGFDTDRSGPPCPRSGSHVPPHSESPGWGSPSSLSPPCRYPHDVVNHLSCNEARNHYGGVVSLIPIVLDLMKEWVAHSEKLPRKALHVSEPEPCPEATMGAACPSQATGTQTESRQHWCRQLGKDRLKPGGRGRGYPKPPWRPPGGKL